MRKTLIVGCFCLLVASCGNWVNEASIEKAITLCSKNGGLKHLSIYFAEVAICNNGAEFHTTEWVVGN